MKELEGTTLKNQYFLRELVGRGAMADVYLAWDKLRSTQMAVKILRRDLASNEQFKEALKKERDLLENLSHPNIVRLYEFEPDEETPFIVMAWVDGGNLRQRIEAAKRPFSLVEVSHILRPICAALQYAHQKGVFHCDIKPSNIMLHKNGQDIFLADFGIARLAKEEGGSGTPPYMAPEQFLRQVSAQSDIYALGITVYEMLSGGTLPFKGDSSHSPSSTTRARFEWEHNHLPLPPLTDFNRALPQSVLDIVNKALDKDPRQRYSSALAFWEAFERAQTASTAGSEPATVFDPAPARKHEPAGAAPPPAVPRGSVQSPKHVQVKGGVPHLYARSGEMEGQSIHIPRQGLKIGRGKNCDLRLQERSVSREHATIILTKRAAYLRDEASSLGTFVNGQRIPQHAPIVLNDGDVIQVGFFQIFELRLQ